MEPAPQHAPRIGTFFHLVGFGLLLLFLGSGFSKQPNFLYLFFSLAAFILGYLFRRRAPRKTSSRFGLIRRLRELGRREDQEKKIERK